MYKKAVHYFLDEGYSCSEAVIAAASDMGLIPRELINVGTAFSGGMGSGCLCGAVAGAQVVISYLHGRNKTKKARALAKKFVEEFKKNHKVTCCKVLTAKFEDFHSIERKNHCTNMVESASKILSDILNEANKTV